MGRHTLPSKKQQRFKVFEQNYEYVTRHNARPNSSYTLSLNAFADLTNHEFKAKYMGLSLSASDLAIRLNSEKVGVERPDLVKESDLPSSVDWRKQGAVTELKRHVVTIDSYADIPAKNEKKLQQAVATQPVSVGICGSEASFQLYSGGIFTGPCSASLDHAVLIVGYDSKDGQDYWIIKNSWGRSWGMDGYMHMKRNTGNGEGLCGINLLASGETCCCTRDIFGICLKWKCCGAESQCVAKTIALVVHMITRFVTLKGRIGNSTVAQPLAQKSISASQVAEAFI
ncbi:UNVERIFIED_CONTAM: putative cysteine protease RD21C [Sesamum radiatum]|uniref:Cysteine protease RD21C n=1 Tax=Sesamum radiatum TaxID=300843 RepID=A0AAW2QE37_SESRA